MKAAFIMGARVPRNDYVLDRFLVVPDDFDDEENKKVHAYFANETYCLSTDASGCIRVTYCDEKFIVLGVGTYISTLYAKCGREPQYCLDSKERQGENFPEDILHS